MEYLYLRSELLTSEGVVHGFSIRTGGVSAPPYDSLNLGKQVGDDLAAVEENLKRFRAALSLDAIATVSQVHGDAVVYAPTGDDSLHAESDAPALEGTIEADAIVAAPGRAAGVRTADCVPILLFDPRSGAAAAVHAGWRGTVAYVAARALEAMHRWHGTRPKEILAAIGPAIGPCCFEVGPDVGARFSSNPVFGPATVEARSDGNPHVALAGANYRLLGALGVPREQMEVLDFCTSCRRDLFYSHRRDAGRTGRHLSVVAGRSPTPPAR